MAQLYCLVKDYVILDGPRTLPRVWRNISGFNKDPALALSLGWLPATETIPVLNRNVPSKRGRRIDHVTDSEVNITWEELPLDEEETHKRLMDDWLHKMKETDSYMTRREENSIGLMVHLGVQYSDAEYWTSRLKHCNSKFSARSLKPSVGKSITTLTMVASSRSYLVPIASDSIRT